MTTTWWQRVTGRPARSGTGDTDRQRATAIRDRLETLAGERLELLADEGVPGRKRRLDAVTGASADLHAELARLEPDDAVPLSPPTRCPTTPGRR